MQVEVEVTTLLVLADCTDQREVEMLGHEGVGMSLLELSSSKQLSTVPGP